MEALVLPPAAGPPRPLACPTGPRGHHATANQPSSAREMPEADLRQVGARRTDALVGQDLTALEPGVLLLLRVGLRDNRVVRVQRQVRPPGLLAPYLHEQPA